MGGFVTIEPVFLTGHVRVFCADARAVLATIEPDSVDVVVTSPPYFGLRSYGSPAQVWGGDPACAHEWTASPGRKKAGNTDATYSEKQRSNAGATRAIPSSGTCAICGAWRGELGLEPTPFMYVDHMVEVMRAVRRVLARRGTMWLNLGDSYVAQPQGSKNGIDKSGLTNPMRLHDQHGAVGEHKPNRRPRFGTLKPKDLIGIPWRVAFALQDDGWWLRSAIVWAKPNGMPESVEDRPTSSHEFIFLLTKSRRYNYNGKAIAEPLVSSVSDLRKMAESRDRIGGKTLEADDPKYAANASTHIGQKRGVGDADTARRLLDDLADPEPAQRLPWNTPGAGSREHADRDPRHTQNGGKQARSWNKERRLDPLDQRGSSIPWQDDGEGKNARSVWTMPTVPYHGAHFATFPRELPRRCILAGSNEGGLVLDPFAGSGTTLEVARDLGRRAIGIELVPENIDLIRERCAQEALPL